MGGEPRLEDVAGPQPGRRAHAQYRVVAHPHLGARRVRRLAARGAAVGAAGRAEHGRTHGRLERRLRTAVLVGDAGHVTQLRPHAASDPRQ